LSAPKILVVEDEASISNLVVSYLRKEDYEVFTAADGPPD
jgi:DNA-binding response OmpR family regulator